MAISRGSDKENLRYLEQLPLVPDDVTFVDPPARLYNGLRSPLFNRFLREIHAMYRTDARSGQQYVPFDLKELVEFGRLHFDMIARLTGSEVIPYKYVNIADSHASSSQATFGAIVPVIRPVKFGDNGFPVWDPSDDLKNKIDEGLEAYLEECDRQGGERSYDCRPDQIEIGQAPAYDNPAKLYLIDVEPIVLCPITNM